MDTRKATSKLIEMAEEGLISWRDIVVMTLKWMSEDDVVDMCKANDIILDEELW